MSKIMMSVFIDPATDSKLELIKQYSHVPKSAMIREAIDQWLERREKGHRTTVKAMKTGTPLGVEPEKHYPES